jgi:hypothetical protein
MKKSQTEIMGLAVIVILVVLGMLFYLVFVVFAPKSELSSKVKTTVLASSTLNALQYTTTDCKNLDIQDLLLDCALQESYRIRCNGDTETSCYYVNRTIADILEKSFYPQDRTYRFSAEVDDDLLPVGVDSGCRGSGENAYQILRTSLGSSLEINLYICR